MSESRSGHFLATIFDANVKYTQFEDAFLLGNGSLGVALFGDSKTLRFNLNRVDIWDYRYDGPGLPGFNWTRVADLVNARKWDEVAVAKKALIDAYMKPYPGYAPAGELVIDLDPSDTADSHHLDMDSAVAGASRCGSELMRCFVHAEQDVFALKMAAHETQPQRIRLFRQPNDIYSAPEFEVTDDTLHMRFTFPDGFSYCVGVWCSSAQWDAASGEWRIRASDGQGAELYLSIATSLDGGDTMEMVDQALRTASEAGFASLEETHQAWWGDFWSKSKLELSRKDIEMAWYAGMYQLGSSSRQGKLPPNLQGVWCNRDFPDWHADYHTDLNVQMMIWPVLTANHPELVLPFTQFFRGILNQVKNDTRNWWELPGAKFASAYDPNGHDLFGYMTTSYWIGAGAWLAESFIWYYRNTLNREFAQNDALPFLEEVMIFYQAYLVRRDDGRLEIPLTTSPESWENGDDAWGKNSTIDICLLRQLARGMLQMYRDLSISGNYEAFCNDLLENLVDYPQINGVWAELECKSFPEPHRHLSVLMPIYPTAEVDLTPGSEGRRTAERSLDTFVGRGPVVDWVCTYAWLSIIASRLGLTGDAAKWLDACLPHFSSSLLHVMKLYVSDWDGLQRRVYQIDGGGGVVAGVNEMLISSLGGVVRLFPGAPADWKCRFTDFRAEGAFLISSNLEDGQIGPTTVRSLCGGECRVDCAGWGIVSVTCNGRPVEVRVEGDIAAFDTVPNGVYDLSFRGRQ